MVSFKTIKFCAALGCKNIEKNSKNITSTIKPTTCSFKIGVKQPEQAGKEIAGTMQKAEQNKIFVIGNKQKITRESALCTREYPRLTSDLNSVEPIQNIELFCKNFKERTGLELHIPDNWNLRGMTNITDWVEIGIKNGKFPSDIKHVVMGHGQGLSTKGTWKFEYSGKGVSEWISSNVPKGEKCLVAVCETGNTVFVNTRPGIGHKVTNSFTNPKEPGKIMESGKNSIIGHYLINDGATYYNIQ